MRQQEVDKLKILEISQKTKKKSQLLQNKSLEHPVTWRKNISHCRGGILNDQTQNFTSKRQK